MDPKETSRNYDEIAPWWLDQMKGSTYGLAALERALKFVEGGRQALDVGCGCEGRFIKLLLERGFQCTGLDISPQMIRLAAGRYPQARFITGDVCSCNLPGQYDLITAWDSTFHLPLESHEPVLRKLCESLAPGGVILFTCGGGEEAGTARGEFGGKRFEYSSPGVPAFLGLLQSFGCSIRHVEYDQYPENHVYAVAQRPFKPASRKS